MPDATDAAAIALEFVKYTDDGAEPLVVGKAELTPDGLLRLTAARDSHRQQLGQAVEAVNRRDGLHVGAPAPAGSPPFAVATRKVARSGEADYLAALQDHFRKYLELELEDVRPV